MTRETTKCYTRPVQFRGGLNTPKLRHLAILNANDPKEPGHATGLYHFGFHVDDHATIAQRIEEIYPEGAPKARPKGTSYAETRGRDPDGNLFDVSTWGWGDKTLPKERGGPVAK